MSQKTSFIQERELQVAERQIESFGQRFGTPHLVFASHAAFPLAVTPDLLYCLWANFGRDRQGQVLDIPWIAVADLLFSGLLSEVGYEIYQMDRIARNLLLQRLQDDNHFGQQRIGELAEFLLAYVQPQLKSNDPDLQDFALAQQWTALAYVQPFDAARRLAKTYQISLESGTELVRMESLVETLAEPLADYQPLLMYARSLGNYARGDNETAAAQLGGVPQKGNAIEVAGVRLPIPKPIQPPPRRWTRRKFLQVAGWTALAGGGAGAAFVLRQRAQRRTAQPKLLPVPTSMTLSSFQFDVPRVDAKGQVIQTSSRQARAFSHDLGNGIVLEMVAIPGGTFIMGAPASERGSDDSERPQHQVTVPSFFMGKFQVTQAQWRVVASLPKVERDLNPDPAYFKGDDRPVEQVSWYDAVEFCQRLSGLLEGEYEYRLPSEAEWEYACRAGTTTPFYFGETLTDRLANYDASQTYAEEPEGEYRGETTPVGSFPPNAFGLYDLHGNVWEWCADTWHDNYEGAPRDGSAWIAGGHDNRSPLRGGSWLNYPDFCRSALRNDFIGVARVLINVIIGFRVVCGVGRTQ